MTTISYCREERPIEETDLQNHKKENPRLPNIHQCGPSFVTMNLHIMITRHRGKTSSIKKKDQMKNQTLDLERNNLFRY